MIEPGNLAPRLACLSSKCSDEEQPRLFGRHSAADYLRSFLGDSTRLIVGSNVAYDFGVMGSHDESLVVPIFQAYLDGRVRDCSIREKLILIREGRAVDEVRPSLKVMAEKYLKVTLEKDDGWRLWFGDLMGLPIDRWPENAKAYALGDACSTEGTFLAQQLLPDNHPAERWPDSTISPDEVLQTRAAFCLHLDAMWGFRTDESRVKPLREALEEQCKGAREKLVEMGICAWKKEKGQLKLGHSNKEIQRRVVASLGPLAPRTEKGNVQIAAEVLERCDDEGLQILSSISNAEKKLSTFIPLAEKGIKMPVIPSWNPLKRTGRTSCGAKTRMGKGNWQNLERDGKIRACVIPRDGKLFGNADVSQGELCTLAQTCLDWIGESEMAEAINAGRDLHLELACSSTAFLAPMTYDEAKRLNKLDSCEDEDGQPIECGHEQCRLVRHVRSRRQFCKVGNFGFPGGLGPDTAVDYAWTLAQIRTDSDAMRVLKGAWQDRWPEMPVYLDIIARLVAAGDVLVQPRTGRRRLETSFCAAANSPFQGLLADAMKEAMWQVHWKQYVDEESALFGSRTILFLHDEFVIEADEDRAPEAADELSEVMVLAMQKFCPGVAGAIKAEPRLMRRWYKGAKETRDGSGRLVPWEPKESRAS